MPSALRRTAAAQTDRRSIAYELIVSMVRRGELRPGDVINEDELATRVSMSRTPLREAMARLTHEGIIVSVPRRGSSVAELRAADIENLAALQDALDVVAADLAIPRITSKDIELLRSYVEEARNSLAGEGSLEVFTEYDFRFHRTIWRITGNDYLVQFLESLFHLGLLDSRRFDAFLMHEGFERALVEHGAIIDSLELGDSAVARHAMQSHRRWYQK